MVFYISICKYINYVGKGLAYFTKVFVHPSSSMKILLFAKNATLTSLRPSDAYVRHYSRSSLFQIFARHFDACCKALHTRQLIWKCRQRNDNRFVSASICWHNAMCKILWLSFPFIAVWIGYFKQTKLQCVIPKWALHVSRPSDL